MLGANAPAQRLHTDWFKRTYVLEAYRHSIALLDTGGNPVAHMGSHGNYDSGFGPPSSCLSAACWKSMIQYYQKMTPAFIASRECRPYNEITSNLFSRSIQQGGMPMSIRTCVRSTINTAAVTLLIAAVVLAGEPAAKDEQGGEPILDLLSYWRYHITMRDAVYGNVERALRRGGRGAGEARIGGES